MSFILDSGGKTRNLSLKGPYIKIKKFVCMKYKIVTYNTSNLICAINKSVLLCFDLLEVDASTLEPRSVLFYELLSSFF